MVHGEIKSSEVLDHTKSPCDDEFFPTQKLSQSSTVLYIEMNHSKDFGTWMQLAKCLRIWDLDARGFHKGMWRIHFNKRPLFIIGSPFSEYSIHKPQHIKPIFLQKQKTEKKP